MIIATTGWRNHDRPGHIQGVLDNLLDWHELHGVKLYVRVGDAGGADEAVRLWCIDNIDEVALTVYHADWDRYGKNAGPMRNKAMLLGIGDGNVLADLLLGFPRTDGQRDTVPGSGTWGCIMTAALMGIKVEIPPLRLEK